MQERDPRKVAFRGKDGRARWHPLFDGNPRLSRDGVGAQWSENRSGNRPYIAHLDRRRFTWVERYECPRGEIYLTAQEQAFARGHAGKVLIEPHIKARDGSNKDWGFTNWQAVVDKLPALPWAQLGPAGTRGLRGVQFIETRDFRLACAVVSLARACVLPEGGLHHAAAAFNRPAVVIFGGFISPAQTGYPDHRNLYAGGKPCGLRTPCNHCRKALAQITPDMVVKELKEIL